MEIRNLRYTYPDGTKAIEGISLAIARGECVGIVGPNGAGKSTLLHHLNGLLPETFAGEANVIIDGLPVNRQTRYTIHQKVGLLFQEPDDQLFCPTVYDDVAFGPQQQGITGDSLASVVRESLNKVGLEGFEDRVPHHLSGGEKRRVCLAGVLACNPDVLVLDEPTSNLDPRGRRELKALLRSLRITTLIATHDLELVVELCPRVIVLDGGTIVADGPTVELLGNEDLMVKHGLEKPHILRHQHPHG
jgi:energy-coupling factor transporter ATP-binding protein EcfA2